MKKNICKKRFKRHLSGIIPVRDSTVISLLEHSLSLFEEGACAVEWDLSTVSYNAYTPFDDNPISKIPKDEMGNFVDNLVGVAKSPCHEGSVNKYLDGVDVVVHAIQGTLSFKLKKSSRFRTPMRQDKNNLVLVVQSDKKVEWVVKIPITSIFSKYKDNGEYCGYTHALTSAQDQSRIFIYTGVTKRGWLTRMKEHYHEMCTGSNKTFHQAWREFSKDEAFHIVSEMAVPSANHENIMAWEEGTVDFFMKHNMSLNMIRGGFAGIRELYKLGLLSNKNPSLKQRELAIREYQRSNPSKGIPNLIISNLWKDDDYATRVICSRKNTLDVAQVKRIRLLSEMKESLEFIVEDVGATKRQVKGVVSGKHYSRVA